MLNKLKEITHFAFNNLTFKTITSWWYNFDASIAILRFLIELISGKSKSIWLDYLCMQYFHFIDFLKVGGRETSRLVKHDGDVVS